MYKPTSPEENLQRYIESIKDPEAKRKAQLDYLKTHGGRDFAEVVEELLKTPGLTVGDVDEINKLVSDTYTNLINEYFNATLGVVARTAKPFIELALFNSVSDIALKGLSAVLTSKWGTDLFNAIKSIKVPKITQVTFETISTRKKLIEFRLGLKRTEFMAKMEKATGTTWKAFSHPEIFNLHYNGLKYTRRPFSKFAGATVDIYKNGKNIAKYRLLD
ncbi:hypothetical protein [Echinicola rosea]|uniref:Uncharacterized protein n=1 Tax=Echinicola rosea TaxID=1807691 RepID=A0ABQ1V0A3_9BACT|nr:hypothetical protein [Echinicola rosea]GGF31392.1 hypothetical protein GCM10011339_19490 [Echinicola rosea]